jgi:hypothetical protein
MKTAQEKAEIVKAAQAALKKVSKTDMDDIVGVITDKIKEFKGKGKVSKDGKPLVACPSRNTGVNAYLADEYCGGNSDVAYKLLELIAESSRKFCVGYSSFGSLLYLPEDYSGISGSGDFRAMLAMRRRPK